jgi:hypothetical protein
MNRLSTSARVGMNPVRINDPRSRVAAGAVVITVPEAADHGLEVTLRFRTEFRIVPPVDEAALQWPSRDRLGRLIEEPG